MIFNNKEVKAMATEIVEKGIDFQKGTVGGYFDRDRRKRSAKPYIVHIL